MTCAFQLLIRSNGENNKIITPFESETVRCLTHFCSDKGFQSSVVNQTFQSLVTLKYAYSPYKNTIVGPKLTLIHLPVTSISL